ncbi:hypothetical protein SRABI83_01030 [Arthrobacter sp. Bi83]|uniref:hypothetical protein n=1 Tax=Arthrobacter sp. Bi83 TaxID=2822353 RepID=UPI001D912C67|nr:hypothetical protein [Arthrobacter sp. Bi83]CAH0164302.1 hypothetical protein SRABI83_01030 [Arthrobacter sp. Bi83]
MFKPKRRPAALGSAFTLLIAMSTVASCGAPNAAPAPAATSGSSQSASASATPSVTTETTSPAASPTGSADATELCGPGSAINFDLSAFQASPKIDNKWFPLKPGAQYTTTGTVKTEEGTAERKVVHEVTGLTKTIDGVKTQVMWDRDYADGVLVESELAFFAQTESGTVWLFGEYPEEYENGKFTGAPSTFIHSISEAQAGVAMPGEPKTGTPEYVQAHAPAVDFLDCGNVFKENDRVCVPTGCYDDVLVIDEHNPLEPAVGHQRKYYSAGTGLVKVTAVGGADQETLELVKIEQLTDAQLKEVNQGAMKLDAHAYQVNKTDYAKTPRAEEAAAGTGGY